MNIEQGILNVEAGLNPGRHFERSEKTAANLHISLIERYVAC